MLKKVPQKVAIVYRLQKPIYHERVEGEKIGVHFFLLLREKSRLKVFLIMRFQNQRVGKRFEKWWCC